MPKDIKNPNIEESRNTPAQMNYYSEMEALMSGQHFPTMK